MAEVYAKRGRLLTSYRFFLVTCHVIYVLGDFDD